MSARRKLSDADYDRIAEMREQRGMTYDAIGAQFGMSGKAVSWICLRLGADPPKPHKLWNGIKGPPVLERNGHIVRRYTEDEDAILLAMEAEGASIAAIARRLDRRGNSVKGRLMTLARREERVDTGEV